MFKRIFLFVAANIAIMVVISIILAIFNVQPYLTQHGIDYGSLMIFSAVIGFVGSFISLLISKWMAKMAYKIQIIKTPNGTQQTFVYNTVRNLATKAGVRMPEVGIYDSPEPNAFATGWNRNNALIAVSTGLVSGMTDEEVAAVLGHEMTHVTNGDMVTMALLQGVLNTFVIFFSRIAAYLVTQFLSRSEGNSGGMGSFAYYGIAILFQVIFGILASMIIMAFSRWREFRADRGSAKLVGKQAMINALKRLQQLSQPDAPQDNRGKSVQNLMINGHKSIMALFASHPPLEKRIEALQKGL
ncbi:MAG: protease HtpX [Coxiellaceae bacterium]|nr:protease HtpX [Coxiellaceae bacterium]